mmetsp:Transcript_14589/g.20603  ORF Transcript_14589/g.20603 Transcript_14589/m.20603 type:complete len:207 (+) Transcript_14589:197-817(+)
MCFLYVLPNSQNSNSIYCLLAWLSLPVFFGVTGLFNVSGQFFSLWGFFTLNVALFSYWGQAFMCLVRDLSTAGALQGALIGMNVFFSGYIVRPQYFTGFMKVGWWISPGHYAYEGLVVNLFGHSTKSVQALRGTAFYYFLVKNTSEDCTLREEVCIGNFDDYVDFFFGGKYKTSNTGLDVGVLLAFLIAARIAQICSLKYFNYVNT